MGGSGVATTPIQPVLKRRKERLETTSSLSGGSVPMLYYAISAEPYLSTWKLLCTDAAYSRHSGHRRSPYPTAASWQSV